MSAFVVARPTQGRVDLESRHCDTLGGEEPRHRQLLCWTIRELGGRSAG